MDDLGRVEAFIRRWEGATGPERANYQLFLTELCALLGLPQPDPARDDTRDNAYVFERRVVFRHGDGSESDGYADLYRRGAFVCEAKKVRKNEGRSYDDAMLRARGQAEQYARALPAAEGRPPFLVVVDVGAAIELYAEFTRSGATYTPFPDPRSHRIRLNDLRDELVRLRLKTIWLAPLDLDPSRRSAAATREIAAHLANIAYALERVGHAPDVVAGFLTRCLFSMFAEDVGLLPKRAFVELLERHRGDPATLGRMLEALWREMDSGGFSAAIATDVLRFNGKIFKDHTVLQLNRDQIDLLLTAARSNWREVEPAIFGTLFERALDPTERHKLGAHYTPRAYVERLVLPTVVEPLREDWKNAQGAALLLAGEGKLDEAREMLHDFHHKLCEVRVLDPACGSGNFLYVTLEHLKRLEGEVLNQLEALGDTQIKIEAEGVTVDPHQLLGIEINPRAAAITELVLWIGYLQWHFRTRGQIMPPQPVLKDFRNIEFRDALIASDRVEYVMDKKGIPVMRWNGKNYKKDPVTGEDVPDVSVQVPVERYVNPRKAEWPKADFVIGNPPFLGSKRMRDILGDGYVDALQSTWPEVPEATDMVMRWWHRAAQLAREGRIRRFGLITTNSLRQAYVRRAVEPHLAGTPPLSLVFAVPDHPWVDSADGAAVRISMTCGEGGRSEGRLLTVVAETEGGANGEQDLVAATTVEHGLIHADLSVGVDVTRAIPLRSNLDLCSVGMKTIGGAFQIDQKGAEHLGLGKTPGLERHIRPYMNGRDFVSTARGIYVIDFFGLEAEEVRTRFPAAYQHLLTKAKPERDQNRNKIFKKCWWVIGHPRPRFRSATAGLPRYIVTVETQKHRFFSFLSSDIAPDSTLVTFAFDDAWILGVLSSRVHAAWALALGGRLGVGNDPRYNKTRCFETFPFPDATDFSKARVRSIAERLDSHRKHQQRQHPGLTLTAKYNVLEEIRAGNALSAKGKAIHEQGLVSVLRELHDDLDRAVFDAYGWTDLGQRLVGRPGATMPLVEKAADQGEAEETLLSRLVALNSDRAAEEKRGTIRWLRPEFQTKTSAPTPVQAELDVEEEGDKLVAMATIERLPWPKQLPDQMRLVARVLTDAKAPLSLDGLAERFTGRGPWKKRLPQLVETLVSLGRVRRVNGSVVAVD